MPKTAPPPPQAFNRLKAVMLHIPFYSIEGPVRLAADTGTSQTTVSRLLSCRKNPSFLMAEAIAWALTKRSGIKLDLKEIFSSDGTYPTASVCELMGCKGCLPPEAWDDETDALKPEWKHQKPGEWSRLQADPPHLVTPFN